MADSAADSNANPKASGMNVAKSKFPYASDTVPAVFTTETTNAVIATSSTVVKLLLTSPNKSHPRCLRTTVFRMYEATGRLSCAASSWIDVSSVFENFTQTCSVSRRDMDFLKAH